MGEMDEDTVLQAYYDEVPVVQIEDDDTMPVSVALRATTHTDWPPVPPPPRDLNPEDEEELMSIADDTDLAMGTGTMGRPVRNARIYAAVRRPPTSDEST